MTTQILSSEAGHSRLADPMIRILSSRAFLIGFMLIAALVVVLTYQAYGFSYDESFGAKRGAMLYNYYFGNPNKEYIKFEKVSFYGLMPDFLATLLREILPTIGYRARHLVSGLFGLVGIYYAYRVGAAFFDRATGALAMVFLAVNPMWNGYMFMNLKDIPFAALMLAGYYYCMIAATGRYKSRWVWLGVALSVGLLATTKVLGVVILGSFCALSLLIYLVFDRTVSFDRALLLRIVKITVAVVVGCIVCLVIFWPQIYLFTPSQVMTAIFNFTDFKYNGLVLLNGVGYPAKSAPSYYMITYLTICMPLFILAAIAAAVGLVPFLRQPMAIACIAIVALYLVYQAVTHATVYNGYRHFTFLIPLLMIVAAWSCATFISGRFGQPARIAASLFVLVGVTATLVGVWRLFPYQYSSYNALVGGFRSASERYEVDVWRTAPYHFLDQIAAEARASGIRPKVYDCSSSVRSKVYPEIDFVRKQQKREAEYLITNRRKCTDFPDVPVVGELTREGVTLSTLHRRPVDADDSAPAPTPLP